MPASPISSMRWAARTRAWRSRPTPPAGAPRSTSGRPAELASGPLQSPVGDLFSGIVSDITGRVVTAGLQANLRSAERQQELDQRLIPGIPSDFQVGYLVLVVLGLFGVPVSRAWWRRIWPPEAATEYAGRAGYLAARTVRGAGVPAPVPAADGAGERALQSGAADLRGGDDAGALVALAHGAARRRPPAERDNPRGNCHGDARRARRCSSPAPAAASGSPSRCGPRATAPTSPSPPRPPSRIPSSRAPSSRPPRRSRRPAARRCRIACDIRFEEQVQAAVEQTVKTFGGLDICVNNASRHLAHARRRHRHEALRPDARHQCARHLPRLQDLHPASQEGRQPAHPHAVAAARHGPEVVRAARRLHHGQVQHEHHRAGAVGRAEGRRHRRQHAVAAHHHRHRGRAGTCWAATP